MPIDHVEFVESWYERLVSRTNEKEILPEAVLSHLSEQRYGSCLEIGLGTAPIFAQRLVDRFDTYRIIEKRPLKITLPKNASFIESDWESYEGLERYDVIIASHVIYYFREKNQAIQKMFERLKPGGRIFIVVNGKDSDYGSLKEAFSRLIGQPYRFTYDEVKDILRKESYSEHSVSSAVGFQSAEDLFETLRLSFDQYPEEYEVHKPELLAYFRDHLVADRLMINQVIFEVRKNS